MQSAHQVRQLAAALGNHSQHRQRRAESVSGWQQVGEDDVSRLLAPEADPASLHFRAHVGVADRAAMECDARLAQRRLEPEVAHHGRHDTAACQPTGTLEMAGRHEEHTVAVDDPAAAVDQDHAVAVAVEGEAQPAPLRDHRRPQRLRMRRTTLRVDIAAVRRRVQFDDGDTEPLQHAGRDPAGRPVCAIDGNRRARDANVPHDTDQVIDVGIEQVPAFERRLVGVGRVARGADSRDPRLQAALEPGRRLRPRGLQDLDSVVRIRVVRSRDGDARIETATSRDDGHTRRRRDADADQRTAARPHSGRETLLDPRARVPSIAPAHDTRRSAQFLGKGRAETRDRISVERRDARHAAHAIGAKQDARHEVRSVRGGRAPGRRLDC